jgi:hypothetical protein
METSFDRKALKAGDFCVRVAHGFRIYSELIDPVESVLAGRNLDDLDDEEREELLAEREMRSQPHMADYRFTRSYSLACREGELGDIHLSNVIEKLTKEEFEVARAAGWP